MVGGIENGGESLPKTRKSHPPSLKAKVAVEAIKAHKTAAQIARTFGVHPTQVGGWKKQALAGLPDIFGGWMNQHQLQIIDYLQEENRVLREQLALRPHNAEINCCALEALVQEAADTQPGSENTKKGRRRVLRRRRP